MPEILLCAATRTEAEACLAGIRKAGAQEKFELLRTGVGSYHAGEALKARLAHGPQPSLIVSTGFAGSWSEDLEVGAWISASIVANDLGNQITNLRTLEETRRAILFSVGEIYEKPPASLLEGVVAADRLPAAVDMESFPLAQIAQKNGIPFEILRYITDSPGHPLPGFVRRYTEVAVERAVLRKATALLRGTRDLLRKPQDVFSLVQNGLRWRSELTEGWARYAHSFNA